MFINKRNKMKSLTVFLVFVFGSFSVTGNSYGQMEVSSESAVQSSLPKPGNITVNFKEVDILTVLNYLSEASGVDIIPTPGVEGPVTMRLRDKPWEVALDIVTRNYGYAYSREADIIRVMPRDMLQTEDTVTEVIMLEHFFEKIELVEETGAGIDEAAEVEKEEEGMEQLVAAIDSILDEGRGEKVTYVSSVNALIVTAIPAKISSIKDLIAKIDRRRPQILLEAKVLRLVLDEDEQMGIDWNAAITARGARRPTTAPFTRTGILKFLPSHQRDYYPGGASGAGTAAAHIDDEAGIFPAIDIGTLIDPNAAAVASSIFTYGTLDFSSFSAVLAMISERDGTTVISTPRIITLDNQKATIKVVDKVMMQKTIQATDTANTISIEFEDEDEAREIGTSLTIVPHVNAKGEITVNLMPRVSSGGVSTITSTAASATQNVITMTISSREANTQIRVKDGETIFIGGLIDDQFDTDTGKLPILGDLLGNIPYIKHLVTYEDTFIDKTEIVFFVTVHLVKDGMDAIEKSFTVDEFQKYWVDYHSKKEVEQEKTKKIGWFERVKRAGEKAIKTREKARQPGAFKEIEESSAEESTN